MGIPIQTREQIATAFSQDYADAQPDKNVARGSDPYRLGRVVSGTAWTIIAALLYAEKQGLPDTAQREFLDRWGTAFNFPRLAARGSTSGQLSGLLVTGTPFSPIPVDTQLTHADGTLYKITTVGAVLPLGGANAEIKIAAISTGLATNKRAGEYLNFTTPPAGVNPQAQIQFGDLTGGLDAENDDDYRVRLLAHIGDPPEGGAIHDYIEWARSIVGVSTAYVWAHRRGLGTIDVAVLGTKSGASRVPNSDVLGAVDEYIESVRPGNVRDWLLLTTTPQTQDVLCTIDIDDTLYAWDWDDAGVGYPITAHYSPDYSITVPTAPAGVVAGKRIQVDGVEAIVTNRVGDVLTLRFENDYDDNIISYFPFDPDGKSIRASGDLVKPVKNAIIALFNTLGPARSAYSETAWIDELKRSKLFAAITDVAGVDDAVLTTPASNITPVDTFGSSVPFLVPGKIEVLKP